MDWGTYTMPGEAVLDLNELMVIVVGMAGLVPVLLQDNEDTRWFTAGYVCLVVGAVASNVEAFFLGGFFNFVEHGVGVAAAGVAFCFAAYLRSDWTDAAEESEEADAASVTGGT